jgi:hypothetical protein
MLCTPYGVKDGSRWSAPKRATTGSRIQSALVHRTPAGVPEREPRVMRDPSGSEIRYILKPVAALRLATGYRR